MRLLLSAFLFFFIQVIPLQHVQGKVFELAKTVAKTTVKTKAAPARQNTKERFFKTPSRSKTSFERAFYDDLHFVNQLNTKASATPFFYLRRQEKSQQSISFITYSYGSFRHIAYSYIFDSLYPKYVFW